MTMTSKNWWTLFAAVYAAAFAVVLAQKFRPVPEVVPTHPLLPAYVEIKGVE